MNKVKPFFAGLRRIGQDRRGTSIIELALLMPILATFLVGISDVARAYAWQRELDQGLARALELAVLSERGSNWRALQADLMAAVNVPQSSTTVSRYTMCGTVMHDTGNNPWDHSCDPGQIPARYVEVYVRKTYEPIFPGYGRIMGPVTLDAFRAVRVQ